MKRYGIVKSKAGHWTFWYKAAGSMYADQTVPHLGRWQADQLVACVKALPLTASHQDYLEAIKTMREHLGV